MNQKLSESLPASRLEQTRTRIVEASVACVKRSGLQKVSLNDIAKEAGVTRPTVYKYFKNKDEAVQFALLQSAYAFSQALLEHVNQFTSAQSRVLEAMMFALNKLPSEPYLALIADVGLTQVINENALMTKEGREIRVQLFATILKDLTLSKDELDEISEFCTRMLLSLLSVKSQKQRSEKNMRAFLQRRLLPGLGLG